MSIYNLGGISPELHPALKTLLFATKDFVSRLLLSVLTSVYAVYACIAVIERAKRRHRPDSDAALLRSVQRHF